MPKRWKPESFRLWLLLLVLAIGLDYALLGFGNPVDTRMGDFWQKLHASQRPADAGMVLVDIDQKSLDRMQPVAGKWPWPRSLLGEMIDGIAAQKPRAIVVDLLLNEPDLARPEQDAYLSDVIARHPEVLVAVQYMPGRQTAKADGSLLRYAELPATLGIRRTPIAHAQADAAMLLPTVLRDPTSWRGGLVDRLQSADGVVRHYYLSKQDQGWRLLSLPAQLAQMQRWDVPVEAGQIRLNWRQHWQHVSFAELYDDFERGQRLRPQDEFHGKIVVIGIEEASLGDRHATPMSTLTLGPEVLATAISNLAHQDWLREVSRPPLAFMAILLAMLVMWAFERAHSPLRIGLALGIATLSGAAASWWWLGRHWFIPLSGVLAWGWIGYWGCALIAYFRERRQREAAIALFQRFLDPRVVGQLVNTGEIDQSQNAQSREITVLFSDIRGFTTLSETRSPEYIVALLNRYFTMQVEIVFKHHGTLDKFIGDAIMAFWGAPVSDPEHARHAVAAAIEMAEALERFKRELTDLGADFDIGIGLHTGPAVVGFIGSNERLDYTAIGDTVNLASRIEGQTKGVARVLVSDATRAACLDAFDFVDKGQHHVKGREQEVELFEPIRRQT